MVNRFIAIFRSMMRLKERYVPRKRNGCKGILRSKWSWVLRFFWRWIDHVQTSHKKIWNVVVANGRSTGYWL